MSNEKEFETEAVAMEFETLFKQSFPKGCDPRQKADLLAFFLAGYVTYDKNFKEAVKNMTAEGALLLMDELTDDAFKRAKFLIDSVVKNDLSHSMFN